MPMRNELIILKLTVMTFNLRMDTPDDGKNAWPYRKEHVLDVIHTYEPAILGTQEGFHHMVEHINVHLTEYGMIGEGRAGGEADEYNAIFYHKKTLKLIDSGQFWLSETPDVPGSVDWDSGCTRICTWGKFSLQNEPSIKVMAFNTHLDHASQLAREKGGHLLTSKIKPTLEQGTPIILTGDFNAEPDNKTIQQIEASGLQKMYTEGNTFHDFSGGEAGKQIDYIFTSGSPGTGKVDRRHFNGKYPSDHYPVVGTVDLEATKL